MQDRLREIEGTLARTSERKNTILYKLSKRKAEEEKLAQLGVKKIPTNPQNTDDEKVIKFALSQLKQEIGDKIAKIRNPSLVDIERDGESVVRTKNDEINKLLWRKEQWEKRLCEVTNKTWSHKARKKHFFGCARQLPEAEPSSTSGTKRPRSKEHGSDSSMEPASSGDNSDVELSEGSQEGDGDEIPPPSSQMGYLSSIQQLIADQTDAEIINEEKQAERSYREAHAFDSVFLAQFRQPNSTNSYMAAISGLVVPDEEELKAIAIAERKAALQEKLAALRERHA